jgi:hypothetical protein
MSTASETKSKELKESLVALGAWSDEKGLLFADIAYEMVLNAFFIEPLELGSYRLCWFGKLQVFPLVVFDSYLEFVSAACSLTMYEHVGPEVDIIHFTKFTKKFLNIAEIDEMPAHTAAFDIMRFMAVETVDVHKLVGVEMFDYNTSISTSLKLQSNLQCTEAIQMVIGT